MSSVFHKHLWVASASQETPTLSDVSLVVKLMATAVIFVGLRLYVDKEALTRVFHLLQDVDVCSHSYDSSC